MQRIYTGAEACFFRVQGKITKEGTMNARPLTEPFEGEEIPPVTVVEIEGLEAMLDGLPLREFLEMLAA